MDYFFPYFLNIPICLCVAIIFFVCIAKLKDEQNKVYLWDPSTMDYFGETPVMNAEKVKAIVASARIAQEKWKSSSFKTRKLLMRTMQRYITENKEFCGICF